MRRLLFPIGLLLLVASAFATTTDSNIQSYSGWGSCAKCAGINANGSIVPYWMKQYEGSPSLDGKSTEFHIGSGPAYSDVLWWKQLTTNYTIINNAHHFVYDTYFYLKNPSAAQNLEFDINQYIAGKGFVYGTQCNIRGGHVWDVWNNTQNAWVHTGVYCATPAAYKWHHVVITVERTSTNQMHYVSIALDGSTHYQPLLRGEEHILAGDHRQLPDGWELFRPSVLDLARQAEADLVVG